VSNTLSKMISDSAASSVLDIVNYILSAVKAILEGLGLDPSQVQTALNQLTSSAVTSITDPIRRIFSDGFRSSSV